VDSTSLAFRIGSRVLHKRIRTREGTEHGGWYGTVLALPLSGPQGPIGLCVVLSDDGELHGVAPEALEPLDGDGFAISVQHLHRKRAVLFDQMVCALATMRQIDIADPAAKVQIEAEVEAMSRSWTSADSVDVRRKGFDEHPKSRGLFMASLTKYLEAADLIKELTEAIGGDSS
jgi:hypothetical protein